MKEKKAFLLMIDRLDDVLYLTDEQAGRLFKSIYLFENGKEELELDQLTTLLFMGFKRQLNASDAKYDELCKKRSENGKKGGRGNKANAFSEKQNKANKANAFSEKQNKANKANTVTKTKTDTNTKTKTDTISTDVDVVGASTTYTPTNYTLTKSEIRNLQDEFDEELINWGIKRLDDYMQRNPDRTFASYYQTVVDWIQQEKVKRSKAEADLKAFEDSLVPDEELEGEELRKRLSTIFMLP